MNRHHNRRRGKDGHDPVAMALYAITAVAFLAYMIWMFPEPSEDCYTRGGVQAWSIARGDL